MVKLSESHLNIIQLLLQAGADPSQKNFKQNFPLLSLAEKNSQDQKISAKFVKLLLKNGARVDSPRHNSDTKLEEFALGEAVRNENIEIVKVLLKNNADMNIPLADKSGIYTPLGLAIRTQNASLIKLFVKHGQTQCVYNEHRTNNDLTDCINLIMSYYTRDIRKELTLKDPSLPFLKSIPFDARLIGKY